MSGLPHLVSFRLNKLEKDEKTVERRDFFSPLSFWSLPSLGSCLPRHRTHEVRDQREEERDAVSERSKKHSEHIPRRVHLGGA